MYKVKQLYVVFDDGDGHKYLIKREDIEAFKKELEVLEDKLRFDFDYVADDYCNDVENLIEHFNTKSLTGEEVYVVLPNDLIEENEMKFGIGDKVKVIHFTETMLDAFVKTIGDVGEVDAIDLNQGDYLYHVTFQNDPEGWNYKETQLEIFKGEED